MGICSAGCDVMRSQSHRSVGASFIQHTCSNRRDTTLWNLSMTSGLGGGGPPLATITGCLLFELRSRLGVRKWASARRPNAELSQLRTYLR